MTAFPPFQPAVLRFQTGVPRWMGAIPLFPPPCGGSLPALGQEQMPQSQRFTPT
ncbi:MAG: hypothetical protein HC919_09600 [Oscillatoriales cyanobacterium SM2_2_1]|nr:hypothetical protein [Oscillatoriales cyanobacterium SM2_2_1]